MVLSKREYIIMWGALAATVLLILNWIIIDPAIQKMDDISKQKAALTLKVNKMNDLLRQKKNMQKHWQNMLDTGLTQSPSAAESNIFHALEDWSNQCQVQLTAITPQRRPAEKGMQEVLFTVAGKGTLQTVSEFLWLIEQAQMPVKINNVTIGSTNSSGKNITLTLKLSVLCLNQNKDAA